MAETIIKIERKGAYYDIETENGSRFKIPTPLLRQFPLTMGTAFDAESYMRAHIKDAFRFACQRAAFFLEKRDYSSGLLKEKLTDCGYTEETAQAAIDYFTERGYVDDRRYACNLIERRSRKVGPYRIRQELIVKKIDGELIDEIMNEKLPDHHDQIALARQYVEKYVRSRQKQDVKKLKANALAMLVRKGFSFDTAREAVRAYFEEE